MIGRTARTSPAENLRRHLRRLMDQHKLSEKALGFRSGVAQKTINNILRGESDPRIDIVAKLAAAFGREAWEMLLPFADDLPKEGSIVRLVKNYSTASSQGREYIDRVADQEARYVTTPPEKNS